MRQTLSEEPITVINVFFLKHSTPDKGIYRHFDFFEKLQMFMALLFYVLEGISKGLILKLLQPLLLTGASISADLMKVRRSWWPVNLLRDHILGSAWVFGSISTFMSHKNV